MVVHKMLWQFWWELAYIGINLIIRADIIIALLAYKDVIACIDNGNNSMYYDATTIIRVEK